MSVEHVKTKVLEEAGERADKLLAEATIQAERILADGRAHSERLGQEATRDARLRLERKRVYELERVQHDGRLRVLSAKNKAIDTVFARVRERLDSLSDGEYIEMLGAWLAALPDTVGGVLRVNPRDEARIAAGLESFNRDRRDDARFTGVAADPAVANGVMIDGPDYTIDCTIDRRLGELRETAAGDVARILFGA